MTELERLSKLLISAPAEWRAGEEGVAKFLLQNGVIYPPCKIGSKIFMFVTKRPKVSFPEFTFIKESKLTYYNLERVMSDFGKTVFLTREEAQHALEGSYE